MSIAIGESIAAEAPSDRIAAVLRSCKEVISLACSLQTHLPAAFGFWDSMLMGMRFELGEDFPEGFVALMSATLLEQLSSDNECMQMSALHGINHLGDPSTALAAQRFAREWSKEVAAYAQRALGFNAP
jgi:hypothetical protein